MQGKRNVLCDTLMRDQIQLLENPSHAFGTKPPHRLSIIEVQPISTKPDLAAGRYVQSADEV